VKGWIVNVDGEAHKRLRSVSTRALNKRFVDSLRPLFESLSKEMTEKAARLKECDYVAEIAYFLPATVILTLLGLPLRHLEKVREWNRAITSALSAPFAAAPTLIAADRAIAEMNSMLREEIARRRIEPQADLLGTMVELSDDESNPLEVDDILGLCHLFLTAGHETTVNSLVFGLIAWYANPEQRELFLSGKVEPLLAIQEMLRYIGMSSAQPRVVGEDFEFRGQQLKKGDVVFLWVLSANNDPDKFPDPGQLDLTRPNVGEVMTFGPGLHHCIGHYIARLELMVFFQTFLPKFSKIEILDDPLALLPNLSFRGLDHLNVRFAE
jgi:cytochrome P450